MDIVRVGLECVAFWAFHCYYVVVVPSGQTQEASTVETLVKVSGARKWRDETDMWLLGQCWSTLVVGALVLAEFDGGKLLAIYINALVPLVFLLFLAFPCL